MSTDLDFVNSSWLRSFRTNLKKWYSANARDLPWRRTRDPYHIWISEIMLQQTTVAAVIPYFEKFLKRFPSVQSLADANESDVLRLWEGLGYYSRARNIHKAARTISNEFNGEFPSDVDGLLELPGIGRYTAGAIASFAFNGQAPILEANTLRLYSRLIGYKADPRSTDGQKLLWEFAERVLPRNNPGIINQALMELGGTICSVKQPQCTKCPVVRSCTALQIGEQHQIPAPKPRPKTTEITEASIAIRKNGKYLLRQCNESERWAGMWDFPRIEIEGMTAEETARLTKRSNEKNGSTRRLFPTTPIPIKIKNDLQSRILESTGIACVVQEVHMTLKHSVTRYRITLFCLLADFQSGRLHPSNGKLKWVSESEFLNYPLSVTGRKFADSL